ncbi:MAG: hypothetical protein A3H98_08275 [Bacteroidetes bacterium RIFCSPLOWO2_02_FULL_36_8]|nr:MAG: hypothetical protein A3H98_08275 [Bacteroidetes bacterium RIFCSPLOWO2_02_FULL_36_8]OFY68894.1 MAG: hypothetical protein A3G23_03690 [Bacteroidetes bacterium RIFCSPLOWO2_12_FULL_37_12]
MIEKLKSFVAFCKEHIQGDEKSESQTFLEHFFMALGFSEGHKGTGGRFEDRIKSGQKTKYVDFVIRKTVKTPGVLIEMKKKDTDLSLHYQQVQDYWVELVPNRPTYAILCNFDEFWIYNFDQKVSDPVDILKLEELPERISALSFLFPYPKEPLFHINRKDVTKIAADKVAAVYKSMQKRNVEHELALNYCLQCVLAMFAEDVGLLPNDIFTRIIHECSEAKSDSEKKDTVSISYDLIGNLFREMNTPGITPAGKYKGVDYFNGSLFSNVKPIELREYEISQLEFAADKDWKNVNPSIFGKLFEGQLDEKERHVKGAHYTRESDIVKVVGPVIVRPWRNKIENAETLDELYELITELRNFKVLDPACGSGNFLYVAYREMKNLEKQLLSRIKEQSATRADNKRLVAFLSSNHFVSTRQFYGIDIKSNATELAKVTLMIAKEQSYLQTQDKYFDKEKVLPLDNLDHNIICADSLFTAWPEADAIIGNPPYQSKNKMQEEFGNSYVNQLREAYPEIPGRADFCVYWFYKAHQHLKENGYAGLVGTNSIRQNYSREGSLDFIVRNGGTIIEAVSSEPWSGDAAVYVSIACWKKGVEKGEKKLFVSDAKGNLELHNLSHINSSLSLQTDVSSANILECNKEPKKCFQGQTHGHEGFLLSIKTAQEIQKENPDYKKILKPFLTGDEFVAKINSQPSRYVIDFSLLGINEAAKYKKLFEIIKKKVLPDREKKSNKQVKINKELLKQDAHARGNKHHINFYNQWWKLSWGREDMVKIKQKLIRWIGCSAVTQRPIFEFISPKINPSHAMILFAFEDDYSFGIIQSKIHWRWFVNRCSSLGETYRYTINTVWDTFPWPQNPTLKQIEKVADASRKLRNARNETMKNNKWCFRDLYRILEQPGKNPIKELQKELDRTVIDAYNFESLSKDSSYPKDKVKKEKSTNIDEAEKSSIKNVSGEFPQPHLYGNQTDFGADEFHESPEEYKTMLEIDTEILEKLLNLNHSMHEIEKREGKVTKPGLPDWVKNKNDFISDECIEFLNTTY